MVSEWQGRIFSAGRFVPGAGPGRITVLDKGDDSALADVGEGVAADVDAAVEAARAAQPHWAALAYEDRAAVLRAAATAFEAQRAELRELIVRETGCVPGKADYEIAAARSELFEAASLAGRPFGEVLRTGHGGRASWSERVPVGVVGVITPWNFPVVLGMRVIAPALALGNAVVLKPSPETPLSGGMALAGVFSQAGLPSGLFEVVPGRDAVGRRLVAHPGIDMVHFTGSTAVGREIATSAAGSLKKVSLELGGNNALVVLSDCDVDQAAMIGAWSSFHYQGQTCITAGRHIVDRQVVGSYVEKLAERARSVRMGDPFREEVGLGPMINTRQVERARAMLDDAVERGARIVAGGSVQGRYFSPTVVAGVTADMRLWKEEIFAPVAPVLAVDGDDDAVRVANGTEYGLVASVLGRAHDRALAVARRLRVGMAHVNDATPQDEAVAPFGGFGSSGYGGRSGGDANLEEFTALRWFTVASGPVHYPY